MATVVNTRDISLTGTSPRTVTVTIPGSIDWGNVGDDGNRPDDNADVTGTTVNGGLTVTSGGITLSAGGSIKGGQTAYATGTGFFLGYSGAAYKFSIGDATHFLKWDGSTFSYSGDLSGSGDWTSSGTLTHTGQVFFRGAATYSGLNATIVVGDSNTQNYGIVSLGAINGLRGINTGAGSGYGVYGDGGSGVGVHGDATGGKGLEGTATSGTALKLNITTGKLMDLPTGKFSTGANTPALTNCPGSGAAKWVEIYDSAGAKHWMLAVKDT
jgi:hypothetical protein